MLPSLRTSGWSRLASISRLRGDHRLIQPCRSFTGNAFDRLRPTPSSIHRPTAIQTLAIETSCDDTSVAILEVGSDDDSAGTFESRVVFHERITSNSAAYGGIHPIVAQDSHERNLADLVKKALHAAQSQSESAKTSSLDQSSPDTRGGSLWVPNFVTVTRGPGMRNNLSVGLGVAKGLAVGWNVPLLGVHHMQAHALTPRLCSALKVDGQSNLGMFRDDPDTLSDDWTPEDVTPRFPFLTVLASGGHTMLVSSQGLTQHKILAETSDIALGDCLDKAARAILPSEKLIAPYGKALEDFAFPEGNSGEVPYDYVPPKRREEELERRRTIWGWSLGAPLAESKGREKTSRRMMYSFAGTLSAIQRIMEGEGGADRGLKEREVLAGETMRVLFEHLGSRILLHLFELPQAELAKIATVVVSGGVASNGFLRHVLRSMLDARGYTRIALEFPPPELCTDNALMIAWAGMEMFDAGYTSELSIQPIRKWSLDSLSEDRFSGILHVPGWRKEAMIDREKIDREKVDREKIDREDSIRNLPDDGLVGALAGMVATVLLFAAMAWLVHAVFTGLKKAAACLVRAFNGALNGEETHAETEEQAQQAMEDEKEWLGQKGWGLVIVVVILALEFIWAGR